MLCTLYLILYDDVSVFYISPYHIYTQHTHLWEKHDCFVYVLLNVLYIIAPEFSVSRWQRKTQNNVHVYKHTVHNIYIYLRYTSCMIWVISMGEQNIVGYFIHMSFSLLHHILTKMNSLIYFAWILSFTHHILYHRIEQIKFPHWMRQYIILSW